MCHVTTFCTVCTLQRETSLHEGISHGNGQKIKAAFADSFFLLRTLERGNRNQDFFFAKY